MTCQTCKNTYKVGADDEVPKGAIAMCCNWCPDCEDKADDYYQEWYKFEGEKEPILVGKNQISLL